MDLTECGGNKMGVDSVVSYRVGAWSESDAGLGVREINRRKWSCNQGRPEERELQEVLLHQGRSGDSNFL